ncbi:glycine betaine ABC transporter substrate-binding protein [Yunchengibacter salinarum]|uniref:glycine betaine ABC transporter substrate-binding protein n=1 Tax=Yunchengibacter salinarum TaxID=3133399 RepID=UPI0035B5C9A9
MPVLRLVFALCLSCMPLQAATAQDTPQTFAHADWAEARLVTHIAKALVESETDERVRIRQMPIDRQYAALAAGDIDLILDSWQPTTHKDYLAQYANAVEDLGPVFTGGRLGVAVPYYVPRDEIATVGDLSKSAFRNRIDGRLLSIGETSGITRLAREAVTAYGLNGLKVQPVNEIYYERNLTQRFFRTRWFAAFAWTPHWSVGEFDMRFLDDPKGIFGGAERVHALARNGFEAEHGGVAALIRDLTIPLDRLNQMLRQGRKDPMKW